MVAVDVESRNPFKQKFSGMTVSAGLDAENLRSPADANFRLPKRLTFHLSWPCA
jgi:hypothetical protein